MINALIATMLCAVVIGILDSRIITEQDLSSISPALKPDAYTRVFLQNVPDTAHFLDVSFDNQYYSYVDQGVLHIFNLSNTREIHKISKKEPIVYALMLNDSDLIMYFYESGNSIHTNTYNIVTQKSLSYHPFKATAGAKIVQVNYAVNTNLVYIVTRTPKNVDIIYRVDIMNNVTTHKLNVAVANFIPSATSLNSYYQGTNYTLYYNYAPAHSMLGKKVKLIGRDSNDQYYLLSQDIANQVEVLNMSQGKVMRKFSIPPGTQSFFSGQSSLYAVYGDKVIDLMTHSLTPIYFGVQGRFVAVINKCIYFLPPQ